MEILGKYLVYKDVLLPVHGFSMPEVPGTISLYEVLRIINRIPLFIEDHLERFENSASLAGCKLPYSREKLSGLIIELIRNNPFEDANILLNVTFNPEDLVNSVVFLSCFVEHHYPTEEQYQYGVDTITLAAVRHNPNAKLFDKNLRGHANQLREDFGVNEVLLVDGEDCITEGSRSNIFFIKGNQVITPPQQFVLPGITRKYIIETCSGLGYNISEQRTQVSELGGFDAAFITGTSPKALPVRRIDAFTYRVDDPVMRSIMRGFDVLIRSYLENYSK